MSGFEGVDAFKAALKELTVKAELAAKANAQEAAAMVVRQAMSNFEGAHKKGEPHVGGARPNIVTGNLRRSIRSSAIVRTGPARFEATVGPTAIYGRRVELGYHGKGSYPFFGPAVNTVQGRLQDVATRNWAKYLN